VASVLRRLFAWAREERIIPVNPALELRTGWGGSVRRRVIIPSIPLVLRLAQALDLFKPGLGDVAMVLAFTCLRWEEAVACRSVSARVRQESPRHGVVAVPRCCTRSQARPSAFQAAHIPSWRGLSERYALPMVAADRGWLLLLLSPLLSAACRVPHLHGLPGAVTAPCPSQALPRT